MAGKYEIKQVASGKFMFNLKAGNGQVIMTSGFFDTERDAEKGAAVCRALAGEDDRFERKESKAGEPYFLLTDTDGSTLGKSEMYASATAMENGIESVKKNGPDGAIVTNSDA